MVIPILKDHDPNDPIGKVEIQDDSLVFTFREPLRKDDDLFSIFGNVGFRVLECEMVGDEYYIKSAQIIEWSLEK